MLEFVGFSDDKNRFCMSKISRSTSIILKRRLIGLLVKWAGNSATACSQEQDKSSDIEQQPPFGDRKISNIQRQNRGGGGVTKPAGTSYNFDKV